MRNLFQLWTALVLFLSVVNVATGLFADQVGKFDWSRKLVGCPNQILFDKSSSGKNDQLLVLSEDNVVASINADSGAISWRHFQETSQLSSGLVLVQRAVVTIAQNGKVLRAWDKLNGQMKWEVPLSTSASEDKFSSVISPSKIDAVASLLALRAKNLDKPTEFFERDLKKLVVTTTAKGSVYGIDSSTGTVRWVLDMGSDLEALTKSMESQQPAHEIISKLKIVDPFAVSTSGFVVTASSSSVSVYDPKTAQPIYEGTVRRGTTAISRLMTLSESPENLNVLLISTDCQLEAISLSLKAKAQKNVIPEWTRYEGLAYISAVEMIDLPLSEAEANIETEFSMTDGNAWHAFTQRIISQVDQMRRMVTEFANEFMSIINSSNINSFSSVLASARGKNFVNSPESFERDYFNMRKLIVATTLKGSVYGIDNSDGTVRWVLDIGNDFEPLTSAVTGEKRVPLLIQRGTAHYKFSSQAIIAMNSRLTGRGSLLVFNPISGTVTETVHLDSCLRRVELLPFHTAEMIHPVVAFGDNSEIVIVPEVTTVPKGASQIHMMWVEEDGRIHGTKLDVLDKVLVPTWQSDLGLSKDDKIIAVAGKSPHQKVHSQGRVLGDRSVLYKYANPNLVAVAAVDSIHNVLSITLIDAVTGQVVYLSRHTKASEPFNMVHCENWLAYTFWNERARRMDLGVMELFDGSEPCDSERFNSLTPRKNLPVVTEQAYVFSQGISAMAVTDTEKGLTTRSLLIAMPFGGLFEVSRRFVDARRPVEMTPEMREEMLVPYMPEILIATEDMINYNQSIHNVRNIKTMPSGLESTSLVFAYGSDLFYTRTTPSGTFDILKDDFDHLFICAVLVASVVGSVVLRRLARLGSLKQAWA